MSCPFCPQVFDTASARKSHIYRHHPGENKARIDEKNACQGYLPCPHRECEYAGRPRFKNVKNLRSHIRRKHKDTLVPCGNFECPQCSTSFDKSSSLIHHIRGEHGIEVEIESSTFSSLTALKEHMDHLEKEQYRLARSDCTRKIYECHRSYTPRSQNLSCSSQAKISMQAPKAMDMKCISRIFAHIREDETVDVEWIKTHTFHDPHEDDELAFRSVPNHMKLSIFSQYKLGVPIEQIVLNTRSDFASIGQRESYQVMYKSEKVGKSRTLIVVLSNSLQLCEHHLSQNRTLETSSQSLLGDVAVMHLKRTPSFGHCRNKMKLLL